MVPENEVEGIESDASEGSSPEASPESSETSKDDNQELSSKDNVKPPEVPFHEHPRFKELVDQKNEYSKRYADMESRYKTLESQLTQLKDSQPKTPTEIDGLLDDLKKIDPRLANGLQNALKGAETAHALQARLDAFENQSKQSAQQAVLQSAVSKINSMHEANKVSDFGKQYINNHLDILYRNGNLSAADPKAIDAAYQEAYKAVNSYVESLKRDVTKSYVETKKKDVNAPTSQPRGTTTRAGKTALSPPRDKDSLRAAVVKSYLQEQSAAREATRN